jgi:NAD(P)-dependent dehydrogenase (short-subunit alcohol dehydrogenase family)
MSTPTVLITGALTGIGRAAALAFARNGYRVAVSGRHEDAGEKLAGEVRALGAEAAFFSADVRREDDVRNLVDQTVARFGCLDAAVNNAGTEGKPGPVTEQTAETYAAIFDTNVRGLLLSMKHELRVMQAQRRGSIINISSLFGHRGAAGASIYVASKHAVEGLTKSAAIEGASYGIRVNAVAPGPIETGMLERFAGNEEGKTALAESLPMKRLGEPDEVANAILFLASDQASFITGDSLLVDGGKWAAA